MNYKVVVRAGIPERSKGRDLSSRALASWVRTPLPAKFIRFYLSYKFKFLNYKKLIILYKHTIY